MSRFAHTGVGVATGKSTLGGALSMLYDSVSS
jgi:hypothetical protein